ncbi:hypothetical protein [Pseudomonas alkylphenolica]|uniref:hypothetical protein n=1 Tax=Pseudomonas alkylphenolica TaxID=237609 RepID=UPI0018D74144|nr:hypothetical protein [Pseudomonas alkylphenolica]MBH3426172.1 hypothetical protein [Pseudomonas alkylphenolica]
MNQNKALRKYAESLILRNPDLNVVSDNDSYPWFIREFQRHLQASEGRKELLLPNLQDRNETIAIFSDYGGEHSASKYHTYSFLIVAYSQLQSFQDKMLELRRQFGLDSPFKEIAYKRLDHGPTRRILEPYLVMAQNLINGLVLTVVVEKDIESLFVEGKLSHSQVMSDALAQIGMSYLKPAVAEKLFRVIHYLSFLVTLLSKEDQKVFWMTDHDSIAANPERFADALSYFCRVLGHYSDKRYALVGGAVPFEEKDSSFLDLLSIPDLVGGAIENYFTSKSRSLDDQFLVKSGSDVILKWLVHHGVGLKKHTMMICRDDVGVRASTLKFDLMEPLTDAKFIPVYV